jgi:C_GCAxxG_C_C family probable redox protein
MEHTEHGMAAKEFFLQGYNCSQSVAAAYAKEMKISTTMAIKMTAGYGAGVGRMREVCGAFLGLVFVAGTIYGNVDPAGKSDFYREIQNLAQQYQENNGGGSIICRELLGLKQAEGTPIAAKRTPQYYQKRPCPELVAIAADIMEKYMQEHPLSTGMAE